MNKNRAMALTLLYLLLVFAGGLYGLMYADNRWFGLIYPKTIAHEVPPLGIAVHIVFWVVWSPLVLDAGKRFFATWWDRLKLPLEEGDILPDVFVADRKAYDRFKYDAGEMPTLYRKDEVGGRLGTDTVELIVVERNDAVQAEMMSCLRPAKLEEVQNFRREYVKNRKKAGQNYDDIGELLDSLGWWVAEYDFRAVPIPKSQLKQIHSIIVPRHVKYLGGDPGHAILYFEASYSHTGQLPRSPQT